MFIRGFVCVLLAVPFLCQAEKFLTGDQAVRLAFTNASTFRHEIAGISPEQRKQIERRSGVRGVPKQQKFWVAGPATDIVGITVLDQVIGKHEYIDYAVSLGTNGAILQVEILEYREHYGDQVRDAKWRNQFRGKTAQPRLTLGKEVYNITGATLSCRHITQGINRVLATYEVVLRPHLSRIAH